MDILEYIHTGVLNGASSPATQEAEKIRAGMWLQLCVGGRSVDISRLRANSLEWESLHEFNSTHWRWTKSIRQAQHAKLAPASDDVRSLLGRPPFSKETWEKWAEENNEGFSLSNYHYSIVNPILLAIAGEYSPVPTTTSLRDAFHVKLGEVCGRDADLMLKFTPHRSAQSLRASYMEHRPVCQKKKEAKRDTKEKQRKRRTKAKKTRRRRLKK